MLGGSWQYGVCPEHRRIAFYSSQRRSGGGETGRGLLGRFLDNLRKDLETNKELEVSHWGEGWCEEQWTGKGGVGVNEVGCGFGRVVGWGVSWT